MKTIFFDFNGTIINDVDLCFNILNKMLEDNNLPKITKERYKDIFTFPIKEYYQKAGFDFKNKSFEELSLDFIKLYQQASLSCPLYEGVCECFKHFKEKGYNLVVLSASQIDNLKEQLEHFNISSYFDAILGISNIYAKSKIDIGLNYINENHLNKEDCIMIGDTLHDKEVCNALGIKCVLFLQGHQSFKVLNTSDCKIVSSYQEFEDYVGDYFD